MTYRITPTSGSDILKTRYFRIYRIQVCRNGYAYVTSSVNHSLVGAFVDGAWCDDAALPDDVRAFADLVVDSAFAPL
jgi:hypothetical protein